MFKSKLSILNKIENIAIFLIVLIEERFLALHQWFNPTQITRLQIEIIPNSSVWFIKTFKNRLMTKKF